jgi:hypothetical protein
MPSGQLPPQTKIQLVGADTTFDPIGRISGRLELTVDGVPVTFFDYVNIVASHSSNTYHTVNSFPGTGENEAMVACRQLGDEMGYTVESASKVARTSVEDGPGGDKYIVRCDGTESTLDACTTFQKGPTSSTVSWTTYNYDGEFDVGVSCTFRVSYGACEECAEGKYNDRPHYGLCADCEAGTYGTETGRETSCDMCQPGTASIAGSTSCTACSEGLGGANVPPEHWHNYTLCGCGLGHGNMVIAPAGPMPPVDGIRLLNDEGAVSFDADGQVSAEKMASSLCDLFLQRN